MCPDGKEKSLGTAISISTELLIQHGLGLAITFFKIILPKINPRTSESSIAVPHLRYFLVHRNTIESTIHKMPALPKAVKKYHNLI